MSALSDFYLPLRVLLQDNDPVQTENTDAMLKAGFQTSYMMGLWPAGYVLSGEVITPDAALGMDFAIILLETLAAFIVGDTGAYSFSTRAMSETDHGERKRDLLGYARQKIYDLRDGDAVFSSRQSFVAFLNTVVSLGDLAAVEIVPAVDVRVDVTSQGYQVHGLPPL